MCTGRFQSEELRTTASSVGPMGSFYKWTLNTWSPLIRTVVHFDMESFYERYN